MISKKPMNGVRHFWAAFELCGISLYTFINFCCAVLNYTSKPYMGPDCLWDLSWEMDGVRSDSSPPCKECPLPPGEAPPLPGQHPPAKCPKCHWQWTSKRDERGGWCEGSSKVHDILASSFKYV